MRDPGGAPCRLGRLPVLRVARHRAVEGHISVNVLDVDAGRVQERLITEFPFHRLADVLGIAHRVSPYCTGGNASSPVTAACEALLATCRSTSLRLVTALPQSPCFISSLSCSRLTRSRGR